MNSKKSKHHKGAKKALKTVTKNGEAEVFVLPPYLLQKLGINLNSVDKLQGYPTISAAETETPVPNSRPLFLPSDQNGVCQIENDSTILKTADLMRKSVLLSPTFATNINNADEERSYFTGTENYVEITATKLTEDNISVTADALILPSPIGDKLPSRPVSYNDTKGCGDDPLKTEFHSLSSDQKDPLSLTDYTNLSIPKNLHLVSTEEHPDEAYASDCSNSNLGPSETSETMSYTTGTNQINQPASIHKINIISEEILTPTQIKELKIFHSHELSDLISVPIKSILNNVEGGNESNQINMNAAPAVDLSAYNCGTTESHLYPNNTETIIFFDDKGNIIQTDPINVKSGPSLGEENAQIIHSLNGEENEMYKRHLHQDSSNKNIMADSSFGACIDLEVTDIEMHLKENEETLDTFVHEITSNENNAILAEIEKSEKETLIQSNEVIYVPNGDVSLPKYPEHMHITEGTETKEMDLTDNYKIDNLMNDSLTKCEDFNKELHDSSLNNIEESIAKKAGAYASQIKQRISVNDNIKSVAVFDIYNSNSDIKQENKDHRMKENCDLREKVDVYSPKTDKASVPIDKIKEIAMYIAQAINNRRKPKKTVAPLVTHKQYKGAKSKLHIQGVEKPGGSVNTENTDMTSKNIKTPTRNITHTESTKTVDHNSECKHEFSDLKLSSRTPEFCLCGDFGSFTYYDLCSSYEHIHFWEHVKIKTDPEIVFSIYSEESYKDYKPVKEINEGQDDGIEGESICWYKFEKSKTAENNKNESSVLGSEDTEVNFENTSAFEHRQGRKGKKEIPKLGDISLGGVGEIKVDDRNAVLSKILESGTSKSRDRRQSVEPNSATKTYVETGKLLVPDKKSVEVLKRETKNTTTKSATMDADLRTGQQKEISQSSMRKESSTSNANNRPQSVEPACSKKKVLSEEKSSGTDQNKTKETRRKSSTIEPDLKNRQQSEIAQSFTHKENDVAISTEVIKSKNEGQDDGNIIEQDVKTNKSLRREKVQGYSTINSELLKNTADDLDSGFSSQQSGSMESESVVEIICEVNSEECKKDLCSDKQIKDEKEGNTEKKTTSDTDDSESDQNLSEIKRRKALKRRRSTTTIDNNGEPSIKRSTKCGVCDLILSESEWENHVSKEHCFIAWKAGSFDIDWKDTELLNKLQSRLEEKKSLSCSFCSKFVQTDSAKRFLTHVRKCSKPRQGDSNTSFDTTKDSINTSQIESEDAVTKRRGRKRKISESKELTKCAVCNTDVPVSTWINHIAEKHNYLAWKVGELAIALEDEDAVKQHLFAVVKQIGDLTCSKCGLVRKYPKAYMAHIKRCNEENKEPSTPTASIVTIVTCGVCKVKIQENEWVDHIGKEHGYLAWKDSDTPLDTTNEEAVKEYLYAICKENGQLVCSKCGISRKYVKSFLQHYKSCNGPLDDSIDGPTNIKVEKLEPFTCGVCHKEIAQKKWIEHIYRAHDYLAWKEGESLDINDENQVYEHLFGITKETDGLKCSRCGKVRRYVKNYLQHIKECDGKPKQIDHDSSNETQDSDDSVICGVCKTKVNRKMWMSHKMKNHYNIAWTVDESPIDYRSSYLIERLIKEYRQKYHKLVCKVCKVTRVSCIGFYAHIVVCGKSPEEVAEHRMECEVCNKSYLRIYHSQHTAWHSQQLYAKERKELMLEKAEQKVEAEENEIEDVKLGSRKAAQRAKTVIQQIKAEMNQLAHKCSDCGFGTDDKVEFDGHFCDNNESKLSDSDESLQLDGSALESDDDDDIDSNVSEEEKEALIKGRREKIPSFAKVQRLPFLPKNVNLFLKKSSQEFYENHFTSERLFPDLNVGDYEEVSDDSLQDYMPPVETSCKLKIKAQDSWSTIKRFEAVKGMGYLLYSMFVGTAVRCISWVPSLGDGKTEDQYLSVLGYNRDDSPRFGVEEIPTHPGLIQIWNLRQFQEVPQFVMGIAHDYGTGWAMDWCPSGTRDVLPDSMDQSDNPPRLGLLAVSFSNGYAYIFSVPYPSSVVQKDKVIYKLKPVAELRMTMLTDRKMYQATTIHWSVEKGHKKITVGYSDGSIGYFDLKTESPFLKTKENGITIFYPYNDERPQDTCITGVATYPSLDPSVMGPLCVSSPTGAALIARPTSRPVRIHSHSPSSGVYFDPLWPSAVIAGDEIGTVGSINELELYGGGRRLGPAAAAAACLRCARLALHAPPALRLLSVHPAANLPKKLIIGAILMTPLVKKKKLQQDELAVKLEPLTYQDTIIRYGLELKLDRVELNKKKVLQAECCPERYPLANVASMAFCPSASHHFKLAVATHSGLLFIFNA